MLFCLNNGLLTVDPGLTESICLKVNFDGLPLYKSSSVSLCPILCSIDDISRPFPLGLFCGIGKPELNVFLKNLCEEIKELLHFGYVHNGCRFVVSKVLFLCDSPARAFVQCILGHTAKNGCGYCTIQGEWFANRVVFPYGPTCPSRTNLKYSTGTENNQISLSPLLRLVDFYGGVPPDYMHAVYQ